MGPHLEMVHNRSVLGSRLGARTGGPQENPWTQGMRQVLMQLSAPELSPTTISLFGGEPFPNECQKPEGPIGSRAEKFRLLPL